MTRGDLLPPKSQMGEKIYTEVYGRKWRVVIHCASMLQPDGKVTEFHADYAVRSGVYRFVPRGANAYLIVR